MSKEISKEKTNSLLNCPFCGGEAKIDKNITNTVSVECTVCHASSRIILCTEGDIEQKAIEAWNTRKPMQNIVERLENHIRYCELCHEEFNDSRMSLTYEIQLNSYKNAIEIVKEEGGMNE